MESTKLKRALRDPTPGHPEEKPWLEDDPVKKREEQNVQEVSESSEDIGTVYMYIYIKYS